MRTRIAAGIVVASLALTSCAGSRVSLPQPTPTAQAELASLLNSPVDESRQIPRWTRQETLDAIDARVLPAAMAVAHRTFNNGPQVEAALRGRRLMIDVNNERINASVGQNYDVTVLGGLIREAGNDAEIALVLAHEYAHAMFGHVAQMRSNTGVGELIGGLLGLATVASMADDLTSDQANDIIAGGLSVGTDMGMTAFSKDMELEADHLALFIIAEAGYDVGDALQFFRRTLQLQAHRQANGLRSVGFFETHPSDQDRLLQLIATKALIETGADRPAWR